MEEWRTYKLGDLCSITSSKRIFADEYRESGVPFYRGKEIIELQKGSNISSELYISEERYNEINLKYGVPIKGEMLLTSVGTLGIPYVVKDGRFYFKDGNLTWFRNFNRLNSRYLYYWFLSPAGKAQIDSKAIGSTQKALTIDCLSKFEIKLPSIEVQERIVSILDSVDSKIACNRQINDNLEQQAQALYKSWFVDFEPFCEEEFIETSLGSIPAGWKVGQLSDICEIVGGGTPSKSHPEYYCSRGIAWITPKDLSLSKSKFSSRGSEDITSDGYKNSSAKLMPRGTVLFSSRAPIGYISIATNEICTNQGFKSAVPGIAGTGYLYYFLQANTDKIESKASGSTFKEASGSLMKALEVIIPADGIFNQFEAELAPILNKQENIASEIQTLTTLRDTILPKLMSGELKINEIDS